MGPKRWPCAKKLPLRFSNAYSWQSTNLFIEFDDERTAAVLIPPISCQQWFVWIIANTPANPRPALFAFTCQHTHFEPPLIHSHSRIRSAVRARGTCFLWAVFWLACMCGFDTSCWTLTLDCERKFPWIMCSCQFRPIILILSSLSTHSLLTHVFITLIQCAVRWGNKLAARDYRGKVMGTCQEGTSGNKSQISLFVFALSGGTAPTKTVCVFFRLHLVGFRSHGFLVVASLLKETGFESAGGVTRRSPTAALAFYFPNQLLKKCDCRRLPFHCIRWFTVRVRAVFRSCDVGKCSL